MKKIPIIIKDNSFENFNNKTWYSLFRANVMKNFFNDDKIQIRFIIKIVEEEKIVLKNHPNLENDKYENIVQEIFRCHERWSKLFQKNKKFKNYKLNEGIKNDKYLNDKTIAITQKNEATKIIKKVIFEFLQNNNISNLEKINTWNKKDIDITFITKDRKNIKELAENAIYIIYFYAKMLYFKSKIEIDLFLKIYY